jgi:hypothetical protein
MDNKWKITVNQIKSSLMTFTMRNVTWPTARMDNVSLPQVNKMKYLGMHLDRRLTWTNHITTKIKQLNLKFCKTYWLLERRSQLTIYNKLLLYKAILKPIWTYGAEQWGTASNSNIEIQQRFQSKILRTALNVPRHISNTMIHNDLQMNTVKEVISERTRKYLDKLKAHQNPLAVNLLDNSGDIYRLKRYNVLDLPTRFNY